MSSPPTTGACRLCRAQRISLRDTLLLPEWSSSSVSEPLFCQPCETRLTADGEYVSCLAYREGGLGLLRDVTPVSGPREGIRVASLRRLDPRAIARFAASVFFRAHVSSRPECKGLFLSPKRAEALREYVNGASALWHMCLTLAALMDAGAPGGAADAPASCLPRTEVKGEDGWHLFAVAGLVFNLSTGAKAAGMGGICLACGHDPHVIFTDWPHVRHTVALADALLLGTRRRPTQ